MTAPVNKKSILSYVGGQIDAERRLKVGQRQRKCVCHSLWHWYDERKGHKFKKSNLVRH